jgi:hypothetical protein
MEKKDSLFKVISHTLKQIENGYDLKWTWSPEKLKISLKDYASLLAEYGLSHKVTNKQVLEKIMDTNNLLELIKNEDTKVLPIQLIDRYPLSVIDLVRLLHKSNYNMYFFINIEPHIDFSELDSEWKKMIVASPNEKLFMYLFSDDDYVKIFFGIINELFGRLGELRQLYLLKNSTYPKYLRQDTLSEFIIDGNISPKVRTLLFPLFNWKDGTPEGITEVYVMLPPNLRKKMFPSNRAFFKWIVEQKSNELFDIFNQLDEPYKIGLMKFDKKFLDRLPFDDKVKIKLELEDVPDEIKDMIVLPMSSQAVYDGEDVASMVHESRDQNDREWVQAFVDQTLWEKTIDWDYSHITDSDIDQYYWDYITEKNKVAIVNKLKENGVEIDYEDDDAVKEAALEDDEINNVLHIASSDGVRSGEENELYKDIKNLMKELFGSDWTWDSNGSKVIVTVDISEYPADWLSDAYNECGEWDVPCMFKYIRANNVDGRDMPSLPEYRYGIQGDFDKDSFNEYISGEL